MGIHIHMPLWRDAVRKTMEGTVAGPDVNTMFENARAWITDGVENGHGGRWVIGSPRTWRSWTHSYYISYQAKYATFSNQVLKSSVSFKCQEIR